MTTPAILVPLDGSDHALLALPVARHLVGLTHGTLHLAHIAREDTPATAVLDRIGLGADDVHGAVVHTRAGEPAAQILALAGEVEAGFIVMCTRTASTTETPLGRTALAVLQGTRCPVVLVRPGRDTSGWKLGHMLVPHDGTPTTTAAMQSCADLARIADAELVVLHVAGGAHGPRERGSLQAPRYVDQPQHEWPAWMGEFLERLGSVVPLESLKIRIALVQGVAADEAVRFADEHGTDLLALAWRGQWADRPSTVKEVLQRAPCPIMVVRAKE